MMTEKPSEPRSLEILTESECRALLAQHRVGRVAITIGSLPAILPVNYSLLNGEVLFRTAHGSKLNAALERAIVAFEIDQIDERGHSGWSVVVVGHANAITKQSEIEQARLLDLQPWAAGPRDRFVRVTTGMISGRRLVRDTSDQ